MEELRKQYNIRIWELISDAAGDGTPLDMSVVLDFLRFVRDSPFIKKMPRGMMGATDTGGITIGWRNKCNNISIMFIGNAKAVIVVLFSGELAKSKIFNIVEEEVPFVSELSIE